MKLNLNTGLSALPKIGAGGVTPFSNTKSTDFDGVDDYVSMGAPSELRITGALTLSAWIKTSYSGSTTQAILYKDDTSGRAYKLQLTGAGQNLDFRIFNSNTAYSVTGSTNLDDGDWHHVMGVFIPSTSLTVYVDGSQDATNTTSIPATIDNDPADFEIGRKYTGFYFDGLIDESSVFNSAKAVGDLWDGSGKPTDLSGESGLVGWWRMGDSGTFNANSQWEIPEQTKINNWSSHSFDFDGVNDRVEFGSTIDLGTTSSESIWIKQSDPTVGRNIIGIPAPNSTLYHLHLGTDSTAYVRIGSYYWTFDDASTKSAINTTNWIHIAIIRTGTTTCRLYVNAVDNDGELTNGSMTGNTEIACLGSALSGAYAYEGLIDGYSVWDEALTSGNVTSIYNSGEPVDVTGLSISGLQGYWRMGEGADWNNTNWQVPDYSKNTLFSQQSFEFDGVDQYVNLGDSDTFSFGDGSNDSAFSISCWINYAGDAGWDGVVSKWDASATKKEYLFYLSANKLRILLGDSSSGGTIGYEASGTFTLNTWTHVVATYDGSSAVGGLTLYVDGSSISVSDISSGSYTAMENSDQPLWIGNGEDGAGTLHPFDGMIDSISIWNAELTSGNVTSIYNSGKPNDVSGLGISGLVGWWKMGEDATFSTNWTIPDASTNSNDGTSANMDEVDKKYLSPTNENRGESSGMDEADNINNAPDNEIQGLSVGMVSGSVVTDVP